MGNCRFKLSELIPNAWFYKLRYIGKPRKQKRQPSSTVSPSPTKKHQTVPTTTTTARSPRRSYYYSRPGVPSPSGTHRKSAGNRLRPRPNVSADPKHENSSAVYYRKKPQLDYATTSGDSSATVSGSFSPEFRTDQKLISDESLDSSRHGPCRWATSKLLKGSAPTPPPVLDLHQIITKLANKPTNVRKTAGVRLKPRSPRISTMKSESRGGRSSGSAEASRWSRAVVKASVDPRRDFKESMEEMIVENNITASKDLEELLACYLCLNSDEYHHIIINVFKQIWLDLNLPPP